MAVTSAQLYEVLKDIIDLPDGIISLHIHLELNSAAIIECEYYPHPADSTHPLPLVTEHKRYKLVESTTESDT